MNNPSLKLRYAKGLGDVISSILHGKTLGWFTHFLTGQNQPCTACSQRAKALNVLFPIPVWKLFFKSYEELQDSFLKDLKDAGYEIVDESKNQQFLVKNEIHPITKKQIQKLNQQLENKIGEQIKDKKLINTSKTEIGDYIVQVNIFQK